MNDIMVEVGLDPDVLLAEWDAVGIEPEHINGGLSGGMLDSISETLQPIAQKIDWAGTVMRQRRRIAERIDPWRCGILLAYLCQPVYEKDDKVVSRWRVFQAAGYWQDREFVEWANEFSGVKDKTWMGWRNAGNKYFFTTVGNAYLKRLGMTPAEFIESTTIDKALKACATMARGKLQPHQLEALVDETVTSEQMRHALRTDAEEWEDHLEAVNERDDEWVELGDSEPMLVYDPSKRVVRLKYVNLDTGEVKEYTILRFPMPASPLVEEKQQEVLDWMGL